MPRLDQACGANPALADDRAGRKVLASPGIAIGLENQIAVRGPDSPFRGPPFTNEVEIKNRGEPGVACCSARSSAVFRAFNCFFVSIDFPFFTSAVAPSKYSVLPGSNITFEPRLSNASLRFQGNAIFGRRRAPRKRPVACLLRGFSSEQCPLHFNFLRIVVWLARNKTSN
jgi:hypothetical protein